MDPLAADFASWSPYNYVLGNPISFIDPDGRSPSEPPVKSFLKEWTDNGFKSAVRKHFNFKSWISGSDEEKRETTRKVYATLEQNDKIIDAVDSGLEKVGDVSGDVQKGALGATAVSGGASSPVSVPVATAAGTVSALTVVLRGGLEYAYKGRLSTNTQIELLVEGASTVSGGVLKNSVKNLDLKTSIPAHGKMTKDAIEGAGNAVIEYAEDGLKETLMEEPE